MAASDPFSSTRLRLQPALVISLHDVSPHTRAPCDAILSELRALGTGECSLLVIPDHHRRGHFLADAEFCAWLRRQAQAGCEVVIHGYFHQRSRRAGESVCDRLTTRVYTADEGEFFDIDQPGAADLIGKARAEFRELGLEPEGFIAPAWLLGGAAEQALGAAGIGYTTRLGHVLDLKSGRRHNAQSLVWSVRSAWRRQMSLAWNWFLQRRLGTRPLLRISIHPVDFQHPAIWRQIRQTVLEALRTRAAFTYERWLARQRTLG